MGAGRVTQVRCVSRKQVNSMLETVMQQGGGGLMLRHPTAEYKGGRSTDLLKVKRFFDKDAVVIGYTVPARVAILGALAHSSVSTAGRGPSTSVPDSAMRSGTHRHPSAVASPTGTRTCTRAALRGFRYLFACDCAGLF
jgi:hypothetical protein